MASCPRTLVSRRPPASAERLLVEGIVLEHRQGVEQLAQSGQVLDLRKAEMLVRHQCRLALLHLPEQLNERLARRQLDPQRQGIDEQPHHALDAGNLRRTTRHRHAEHHVLTPAQAPEQNAPGRLDEGVECETLLARLPAQRRGERLAQLQRDLLRRDRRMPRIVRGHMGGLFQPGQCLPPGRYRGSAILRRRSRPDIRGMASPAAAPPHPPCAHRASSSSCTSTGIDQPSIRM